MKVETVDGFYSFEYLIEKINQSEFDNFPYKHIYIDNFFSDQHFDEIISCPEINLSKSVDNNELIEKIL